jgi:hypothetical protein
LKPYLILLQVLLLRHVHAQPVAAIPVPASPGAYSRLFTDAFSIAHNPAALASIEMFTAGVYSERRFMLPDVTYGFLAIALPLSKDGAGMQVNYLRAGAYTQSEIGIAYAKKLGQVDLGVKFSYHKLAVQGYGSEGNLIADIGSSWHITDNLHAGVNLYNPVGAKSLSYVYTAGLGYEVSKQVLLSTEIIKEENKPPNIFMAVHYEPAARVLLQAGIATATAQPYLSMGFQLSSCRIVLSVNYHSQLGFSPALALMYKPIKHL